MLGNRDFSPEFRFAASRSGGPGGQNVNKVSTKIELRFSVRDSLLLTQDEKEKLLARLANSLTNEGELIITVQTSRSQIQNKEESIRKFYQTISAALATRKKRKPTAPTRSSILKRLQGKKRASEKKRLRKEMD
jgi:ribosome-associated protein